MAKAKTAAKTWTKEAVESERPTFVPASEYTGDKTPAYYKQCPSCKGYQSGNRSVACSGCGAAFPEKEKKADKTKAASRPAVNVSYSVRDELEMAQRLTELLGNSALEVISVLQEYDLDTAKDAIEKWDNLVAAAGNEAKAKAMIDVLYPSK